MEAVNELGLTTIQLEQINACRMFLQITTLAEMTDHTGYYLLPQALLQAKQEKPEGLAETSQSTIDWPKVGNLTKATWQLWTQIISPLFTRSARGTRLRQPLGEWLETYQTHRFWKWRMTTTGQLLQRKMPTTHPRTAIQVNTTQTYMNFSLTIPTNQPFHGPPVTPMDTHHRQI